MLQQRVKKLSQAQGWCSFREAWGEQSSSQVLCPTQKFPTPTLPVLVQSFHQREKNATPFPQNKVIKSAVSMTMRQLYTCPIHNIFPRSVWTSVIQSQCFHGTKSCYCCILQTIERKASGISKAIDLAETPQFNLWSQTADRLQTQFYFRVTKAMNLVLCHLNQCWLMSFKTFKSVKGSSSERKGFTWHRRDKTLLQGDMSQVFFSTEARMEFLCWMIQEFETFLFPAIVHCCHFKEKWTPLGNLESSFASSVAWCMKVSIPWSSELSNVSRNDK